MKKTVSTPEHHIGLHTSLYTSFDITYFKYDNGSIILDYVMTFMKKCFPLAKYKCDLTIGREKLSNLACRNIDLTERKEEMQKGVFKAHAHNTHTCMHTHIHGHRKVERGRELPGSSKRKTQPLERAAVHMCMGCHCL